MCDIKLVGVEKDERFMPALQMLGQAVNFQGMDEFGNRVDFNDTETDVNMRDNSELDDHIMFQLLQGDILRVNERKLLQRFQDSYRRIDNEEAMPGDVVFTGNLPFGIATPLFIKWLRLLSRPWDTDIVSTDIHDVDRIDRDLRCVSMLLMFQKEVAERIACKPGKRDYGRLSVLTQNWFRSRILFDVKGGSFVPPPKVDASVILMEPRIEGPLVPGISFDELEQFVQLVFKARRKRITSTIKQDLIVRMSSGGEQRDALSAIQIDKLIADLFREAFPDVKSETQMELLMHRRAQEFSVVEMCTLAKTYRQSPLVRGLAETPTSSDGKEEIKQWL